MTCHNNVDTEGRDQGNTITFMTYNMTGADTIKCQWLQEIFLEYHVNFCGIQEHFKTTKSTQKWFCDKFNNFDNYVIPAYRLPGVDYGRGRGGLAEHWAA